MATDLETHLARRRDANRKWRLKNPEKARQYARENYKRHAAKNRERINQRMRDWRKNNPEKHREQKHRWQRENRARYLACKYVSDKQDRESLVEQYARGCAYCGSVDRLEVDHKYPRSRGGKSSLDNLRWLCLPCNRSKQDLTEEELVAHLKKMLKALDGDYS